MQARKDELLGQLGEEIGEEFEASGDEKEARLTRAGAKEPSRRQRATK
jgi:hypothetical protein